MATGAALQADGFAWRILLGPSHGWPAPNVETPDQDKELPLLTRCELCREPVGTGKPYTTNSAGEQAIHLACLNENTEVLQQSRQRGPANLWQRFRSLIRP